jgi:glycosyltransferase involved in cell wall biosynthesis
MNYLQPQPHKKIAFVVGSFLGDTGGGKKIVAKIINELAKRKNFSFIVIDFESRIIDKKFPISMDIEDLIKDIKFFVITSIFFKRNPIPLLYRFIKLVKIEKPDLIIDVTGPTLKTLNLLAVILAFRKKDRPKYIFFDHSPVKTLLKHSKFYFIYRFLSPLMYRKADMIGSVSKELVANVAREFSIRPEKTVFIYNPIDIELILKRSNEPVFHPWFINKNLPIILTVCRLDSIQKDVPLLIRAFVSVKKTIPCRLVVIGTGPQENELKKLVSKLGIDKDTWFVGYDKNPYKYMAKSDVFVLSTKFEALPLVLGEAMACGCPIISSDCDFGPREILDHGKYGILVPVGNEHALADAILKILSNPELRMEYIKKGRERVRFFSIETAIEKYETLFQNLLKEDSKNYNNKS